MPNPYRKVIAVWNIDRWGRVFNREGKGQAAVDMKSHTPSGRRYTHQMGESSSARYGLTDKVQSQTVPSLICQEP